MISQQQKMTRKGFQQCSRGSRRQNPSQSHPKHQEIAFAFPSCPKKEEAKLFLPSKQVGALLATYGLSWYRQRSESQW